MMFNRSRDDLDPKIVKLAAKGDLSGVKACIRKKGADCVDSCGQWTETEDKYDYEKSWDWDRDTALVAAVRYNHLNIVQYLMDNHFPNPFHSSCLSCDEHDNVMSLVEKNDGIEIGEYICESLYKEELAGNVPSLSSLVANQIKTNAMSYSLESIPEMIQKELEEEAKRKYRPEPLSSHSLQHFYSRLGKMFMDQTKPYYNPQKAALWLARSMRNAPTRPTSYYDRSFDVDSLRALQQLRHGHKGVGVIEVLHELEAKYEAWKMAMAVLEEEEKKAEIRAHELYAQHLAKEKRREEKRRSEQKKIDEEFAKIRQAEVERCCYTNNGHRVQSGLCTNSRCHNADYCTYYHPGHDLPPHCMHGERCTYKDACRYNHLPSKRRLPDNFTNDSDDE